MATEKNKPKADPEVTRRKKEETSRRNRRRTRQLFGVVLTVFILVGAVSIVGSGINLVRSLMDTTDEQQEFMERVETMVWFDVIPFSDYSQLETNTLRQIAIWGVYNTYRDTLEEYEDGAKLVPVLEMEKVARGLFGPGFTFPEHETFVEPGTNMTYPYLDDLQAYLLPVTSMQAQYVPVVADYVRLSGGGRRVTIGYVNTQLDSGEIVLVLDYEHPVKYMDYYFYRDGSEYYLERLERNTTIEVVLPDSGTATPALPDDDDSVPGQAEDEDELFIPQGSSSASETSGTDDTSDTSGDDSSDLTQSEDTPEE